MLIGRGLRARTQLIAQCQKLARSFGSGHQKPSNSHANDHPTRHTMGDTLGLHKAEHMPAHNDSHEAHHDDHHDDKPMTKEEIYQALKSERFGDIKVYLWQLQDVFGRHKAPDAAITTTKMLKRLPANLKTRILKTLAKETECVDSERENIEQYNPPRLHENSVFLYQSEEWASKLRRARQLERSTIALLPFASLTPLYSLSVGFVLWYINLRVNHYAIANRLVVRMDLLPHLEMIAFQKVGLGGRLNTTLSRISDLEKIEPDWENENAFWDNNQELDRDLIYKDKSTGEMFVFDKKGFWSWEGISHPLLY